MAGEDCSSGPKSPLLSSSSSSISSNRWCAKLIDVEEAKNQMIFSLPMVVVNSCFYFINLISVMFAGHLGKLHLAASNLANSWAMVTGFSFMVCKKTCISNLIVLFFAEQLKLLYIFSRVSYLQLSHVFDYVPLNSMQIRPWLRYILVHRC